MQPGKKYTLDNQIYLCLKAAENGPCRFQKVNPDGSPVIVTKTSSLGSVVVADRGTRIIWRRLVEMRIV